MDSLNGFRQRRRSADIRPLWKAVADGCHPDRDTGTHLKQTGFSSVQVDRFSIGIPPVSPHIVGTATK